jgi:hypothetical protein
MLGFISGLLLTIPSIVPQASEIIGVIKFTEIVLGSMSILIGWRVSGPMGGFFTGLGVGIGAGFLIFHWQV